MSTESDKPEGWLDFKEVKARASIPVVLKYLKLTENLEKKEDEWIGFCPFHPDKGKADSFHVSESKKAFHCFACKRKGSVLDLVQLLLAYRGESLTLREAANGSRPDATSRVGRGSEKQAEQDRLDVGTFAQTDKNSHRNSASIGFQPVFADWRFPASDHLPWRILGSRQAHGIDHPLVREVELAVQVEMPPGDDRAVADRFEQFLPALFAFLQG